MQREKTISLIPLDQIRLGDNVRTTYDQIALGELAESIRVNGLLQPVTVQKIADADYLLIIGHRRYAAYQLLANQNNEQFQFIPALVALSLEADEIKEIQLVENIQRENLSALEIRSTLLYFKDRGYSQKVIAEKLGKSVGYIKNLFSTIKTLDGDPELEALLSQCEAITLADIQEVQGLDKRQQMKLLKERATGAIKTLRELREKVKAVREAEAQFHVKQSDTRKSVDSYSKVFRLNGDELSFMPIKINFTTITDGQRAELKGLLSAALEKL
jgi:ParB family chromosome partitioning protein